MSTEKFVKFICDLPLCPTIVYQQSGRPPGWKRFRGKDYCQLHTIKVLIDDVEQPVPNDTP